MSIPFILSLNFIEVKAKHVFKEEPETILDSLLNCYGTCKDFDSAMLEPALLAIQYYPELSETAIQFEYRDIPTLMAARPSFWSVFKKRSNRKYIIFISTNPMNKSSQIFTNMSLASKTGILGHEFAHILVYEQLSGVGIILFGIKYLVNKKTIERSTDLMAIERGLGHEMLDYNQHIKKSPLISKKYLKRKKKYYLSVTEIQNLVEKTL